MAIISTDVRELASHRLIALGLGVSVGEHVEVSDNFHHRAVERPVRADWPGGLLGASLLQVRDEAAFRLLLSRVPGLRDRRLGYRGGTVKPPRATTPGSPTRTPAAWSRTRACGPYRMARRSMERAKRDYSPAIFTGK